VQVKWDPDKCPVFLSSALLHELCFSRSSDPYRGWHGSFLNCYDCIIDSLSTVGVYTALHIPVRLFCTQFCEYYTQQLPSSVELMILLKQCCVQDWVSYTCHNKCDVSEGDFHNHCQNLMIACCSSCYIANFSGEYCAEILVFACTPHDVGHGFLHIQLYTVQTQHINKSGNFLAVCTFLMTKKKKKLMMVLMGIQ